MQKEYFNTYEKIHEQFDIIQDKLAYKNEKETSNNIEDIKNITNLEHEIEALVQVIKDNNLEKYFLNSTLEDLSSDDKVDVQVENENFEAIVPAFSRLPTISETPCDFVNAEETEVELRSKIISLNEE
eukprot:UN29402